jgi:alcohol dehydrogenase class IV
MEVIGQGKKIVKPAAPWIAIPTTAGTGAEATRNAVIGFPEKHFKASIRSEHLMARVALIDPKLQLNVRPEITARSGMDALCQCIEAFTSNSANPLSDAVAHKGMFCAAGAIRKAFHDGTDLAAREQMALAALFSGMALANAGLGAVHGFASPLGASFPVPHGTVCAALLPHVLRENVRAIRKLSNDHPPLERYKDVVSAMQLSSGRNGQAPESAAEAAELLARELKIPALAQFGLRDEHIPEQVQLAKKASSMRFNPVVLSDDALADILRRAIHSA